MFSYVVLAFLLPTAEIRFGATENTEKILQGYVSIFKARISHYKHCNIFHEAHSNVSRGIVNWFASTNGCPNIILNKLSDDFMPAIVASQGDFIVLEKMEDIVKIVSNIPKRFIWNEKGDAHFIIGARVDDLSALNSIFKFLWDMHFVNYVIVFVYRQRLEVFSYDAFRKTVLNLTSCSRCPLFSREMDNFWGYPLRINLFVKQPLLINVHGKWSGGDYETMTKFADTSNVTLRIVETSFFPQARNDLVQNRSDICFVSSFMSMDETADYSYPHHSNHLVALVPRSPKIPQYQIFFYVFDAEIWVYLTVIMLCFAYVTKIVTNKSYWRCLLDIWRSFIQQGITNLSRIPPRAKLLLGLWFFFSLVFSTTFQTLLTSLFITSKYFPNIETISELKGSKHTLNVPEGFVGMIPEEYGLRDRFRVISDSNEMHRMIMKSKNLSAYILTDDAARVYIDLLRDPDNKPLYHVVKEKLVPGLMAFMFQKKSPFIRRVNNIHLLLKQHGLSSNFIIRSTVVSEHSGSKNICLSNLQGAFSVLVFGYVLSIVLFIVEIFIGEFKSCFTRKIKVKEDQFPCKT